VQDRFSIRAPAPRPIIVSPRLPILGAGNNLGREPARVRAAFTHVHAHT
jgi:hypothetical protein